MMTLLALSSTALSAASCKTRSEDTQAETIRANEKPADPPKPMTVREGDGSLIFGYKDPTSGDFVTATSISEVPEAARSSVVVTDLSKSPEERAAGHYIFVADLTKKREDGTYAVAMASRFGFENPSADASAPQNGQDSPNKAGVTVYSASWCGVCRQAKHLLQTWNVPFTDKDIEASKSAREELASKARAHGVSPSGVPVIDVGGDLLLGLDERALRDALVRHGFLH